jgi:predicted transcriptional regulator
MLIAKGMISINGEHNNRTITLTEKGEKESERFKKG